MAAPTSDATRRFDLPTRSRPHMAQSRHAQCADECPLLGAKRTLTNRGLPISILSTRPSKAGLRTENSSPHGSQQTPPPLARSEGHWLPFSLDDPSLCS